MPAPIPRPPSPPASDPVTISSMDECRQAYANAKAHLNAAIVALSSHPPVTIEPVTRPSLQAASAGVLKANVADRLPQLVDGYNSLLSITSSLAKGLIQNQAAVEWLIDTVAEGPEAPSGSNQRNKRRGGPLQGPAEKKQRKADLNIAVHYVFKLLVGMEHSSGPSRIEKSQGILTEGHWPAPTESGFEEVPTGEGSTATFHRPAWQNSRSARPFLDAAQKTIREKYPDLASTYSEKDIADAVNKYYNSVSGVYRARSDPAAGEAKERKDRANRRQQRANRTLDLRTKHFDASPLALCREADFLRQSVLLLDVVPEQLSDDEEGIFRKTDDFDERAVLRARATARSSTSSEMHHRREKYWVSRLVRHAGATLDAFAAQEQRPAHVASSSSSSSRAAPTTSARASTFPIPRELWSTGNVALPTVQPRGADGFALDGAIGSEIPRRCVSTAERENNPVFAQSLYADTLPTLDATSKPRFFDLLKAPEWASLMETVNRQLRTPRLLKDDQLRVQMDRLKNGEVVEWSDVEDVESDASDLPDGIDVNELFNNLTQMDGLQ